MLSAEQLEQLYVYHNKTLGSHYVIAIDNTLRGPALGGCRISDTYVDLDHALSDAIALAKAMTMKSTYAGLPFGGGKAVILMPKEAQPIRDKILKDFATHLNALGGRYITSLDFGSTQEDIQILSEHTNYLVGLNNQKQNEHDTAFYTAAGIFKGMKAALVHTEGEANFIEKRVVVKGVGKVGLHLIKQLLNAKARVFAFDINAEQLEAQSKTLGFSIVTPDEAISMQSDIFAPCSKAGTVTEYFARTVNTRIICGAENNQIASDTAERILMHRHVHYLPDFVVNAGGVLCAAKMMNILTDKTLNDKLEDVHVNCVKLLEKSQRTGLRTSLLAREQANNLLFEV
ncbi:MAG: hypothetical protein COV52_10135 [Gammaproteobacteria bacterium CG11_big_fil_rev_8_21_14_0_20_46_22]|nr:MAG: hypothetical protein COW05_09360 [Gammaproteobacteria bacterium CG12_big_fil_rev_8_21_14_0_65_46_12]PIR10055.1 MAG: hypothetical protein COV52_10135 [Gammaproteobacteria bacterium CG11_big_fil_rev_8_21_14_0_20_46_22]